MRYQPDQATLPFELSGLASTEFDVSKGPASAPGTAPQAARFLEGALLFTFVAHLLGMLSMLFLLPGLPGGSNALVNERSLYIAQHPWLWRLGWFPWQLTALSDVLLSLALLWTPWVRRLPAALACLATIAGVIPDQYGQAVWITRGVQLARDASATGDFVNYSNFESSTFVLIAGFGTVGYLLGALAWTWCFAAAGTWERRLTWLSVPLWSLFVLAAICIFLPESSRPTPKVASFVNAIAFVLFMAWLFLVAERVWARCRPRASTGRYARWEHPSRTALGQVSDLLANNHLLRAFGERCPGFSLVSEVTNVVYISYLVEASRLRPLVPAGLQLQCIGPNCDKALFTCLTYRHGHLGPPWVGPFRSLLPSPIQSNWRIYVTSPSNSHDGVYFISTSISSTTHALAARFFAEGLPMHVPQHSELEGGSNGSVSVALEPGAGTSPDLHATLTPSPAKSLPKSWYSCFLDYDGFLGYCVPQDRALSCQPWYNSWTRQEIVLEIPLQSCVPLTGVVFSNTIQVLVGDGEPVCFLVPKVNFRFISEIHESL